MVKGVVPLFQKSDIENKRETIKAKNHPGVREVLRQSLEKINLPLSSRVRKNTDERNIQRWCVIRKYGDIPNKQYVKIEIVNGTDEFISSFPSDIKEYLISQPREDLAWWQDEVETLQIPLSKFKEDLVNHHALSESEDGMVVEEGMVFLCVADLDSQIHIIPFTFQARKMSEMIYQKLLGKGIARGKRSEGGRDASTHFK